METNMPTKEDGWCGALTLPRELTLKGDKVLMNPVQELTSLRKTQYNILTNKTLSNSYVVEVNEDLLEIQAVFGFSGLPSFIGRNKNSWNKQ